MNIVFAHFYTPVPSYLKLNLQRSVDLFPNHSVFLVTDDIKFKLEIANLNVHLYRSTDIWRKLEQNLQHPRQFRSNFWFTSLARFIALADFCEKFPGNLLHIESDVIISEDFPFGLLSENDYEFQFPIVGEDRAIASVMYLKNLEAATYLSSLSQSEALMDPMTTDMKVLKKLTNLRSRDFFPLPTSPSQPDALPNVKTEFLKKNTLSLNYFHGVFDGFDLGRYLFGEDPRNNRGFSKVRCDDPNAYLKGSKLDFSLDSSRKFPYVYDETSKSRIPIYALHIHCKKPGFFVPELSVDLFRKAIKVSKNLPARKFYFLVFLKSLRLALARRIKRVYG